MASSAQTPSLAPAPKTQPDYPSALYDLIFDFHRDTAEDEFPSWNSVLDIGSASSTVTERLASQFELVTGSDLAAKHNADLLHQKKARIARQGLGNVSLLPWCPRNNLAALGPASVDMVTCAEAIHWLDNPKFIKEASRVLAPGGTLAMWYYRPTAIVASNNKAAEELYKRNIAPYVSRRNPHDGNKLHSKLAGLSVDHPNFESADTLTNSRQHDEDHFEHLLRDCKAGELRDHLRSLNVVNAEEWRELDEKFAEIEELLGGADATVTQDWDLTVILATKKDLADEVDDESDLSDD